MMTEEHNDEVDVLLLPKSTLILKPISNGRDSKTLSAPLILVPTEGTQHVTKASVAQYKRKKTPSSDPLRPNWSKKIQLMKGDLHYNSEPLTTKNNLISKIEEEECIQANNCLIEPIVNLAPGFSIAEVEINSLMCFYYTGFDSYFKLKELFERLHLKSPPDYSLLSLDMEFLLCITKLRKNKDFEEMGYFFNITSDRAQEIFEDWIQRLYDQFEQTVFWVSKNYIIKIINQSMSNELFGEEFLSALKMVLKRELKERSSLEIKNEEFHELIQHAKMYQILNRGPMDESTARLASKIAHICLSISNYHLYPNYVVLLS